MSVITRNIENINTNTNIENIERNIPTSENNINIIETRERNFSGEVIMV